MKPEFFDIRGGDLGLESLNLNRGIVVDVDPFLHFLTILLTLQLFDLMLEECKEALTCVVGFLFANCITVVSRSNLGRGSDSLARHS